MDTRDILLNTAPTLSEALVDKIVAHSQEVDYPKGALILDFGISTDFLPILIKGNARVMRIDNDDPSKELLLYFLTPGEICPCAAFSSLPNGEMPITVEAETNCTILQLPLEVIGELNTNYPEWRIFELINFRNRFEELLSLVDNAIFRQLSARLQSYMEKRCRISGHRGVALSKVKMASELGTSREVVSRLLKNLEKEGVITQDKDGVHLVH